MESLAILASPSSPQTAQSSDDILAGLPVVAASGGVSGQSFVDLLALQMSVQQEEGLPVQETGDDAASAEAGAVASVIEVALLDASTMMPQGLAVAPVALASVPARQYATATGSEKVQATVQEVLSSVIDGSGGKGLPLPGVVASNIAVTATSDVVPETKFEPAMDMQGNDLSVQRFDAVSAERKSVLLLKDAASSPDIPFPQAQFQPVAATSAGASSPVRAEITIPQKVGAENWASGLGDKVVWVVGNQTRGAEIHLNPPALGPLEIRVQVADGQANLAFMTQHASVREAIELATPRLREMLGDAGIAMGNVSVNVGTFAQQQQLPWRDAGNGSAEWLRQEPGNGQDKQAGEQAVIGMRPLRGHGMVDLFA